MQYEGRMVCVLISGVFNSSDFQQPTEPCLKNGLLLSKDEANHKTKLCDSKTVLHLLFGVSLPTVCVTGAGVGVDSAWKQEKLEARKMLENAAESPASSACFVRWRFCLFYSFCLNNIDLWDTMRLQ